MAGVGVKGLRGSAGGRLLPGSPPPPLIGKLENWELEVGAAPPLTASRADYCLVGAGLEEGVGRRDGAEPCWRLRRTSRGSSVAGEEGEALRSGLA